MISTDISSARELPTTVARFVIAKGTRWEYRGYREIANVIRENGAAS